MNNNIPTSSFNMWSNVVLPALSRPRKTNLPDFLYKPILILIRTYLKNLKIKRIKNVPK